MGARPIALMDPLRFGSLDDPRTRFLFEGVVSGISGYGNAVGVPTVGGEVVFDDCYRDNPLVNVFCLGLLPQERLVLARAEGVGNLAVLLGSSTGRDGIGGASVLASAGFEEGSEAKRPSVQVGDPYEEKRLIEACLALLDAGLAVGVQDLGAAGLSCAASETAAEAGAGMDVDIARVHQREPGMNPVEVMTSESQERMLAIVRPEDLDEVLGLCARWEIRASVVGQVTDTGRFRVFDGSFDSATGGLPDRGDSPTCRADSLGDGPVYDRPLRASRRPGRAAAPPIPRPRCSRASPTAPTSSGELLALLATPTIADKSWVWHQYDHQLFLNTVVGPGGDATVLRLKGTPRGARARRPTARRASAGSTRAPARGSWCSKPRATSRAPAREPRALVNCLNFGNPEHPEVMWQFSEVVDGMSEACRALDLPVIGGNVSFYNESRGRDIDPTPVVGVVGLIEQLESRAAAAVPARRRSRSCSSARDEAGVRRLRVGGGRARARRRHAARGRSRRRGRDARLRARARRRPRRHRRARLRRRRPRGGARRDGDRGRAPASRSTPEAGIPAAAWCFSEIGVTRRARRSTRRDRGECARPRRGDAGVRAVDDRRRRRRPPRDHGRVRRRAADAERTWRDAIPNLVAADVHV